MLKLPLRGGGNGTVLRQHSGLCPQSITSRDNHTWECVSDLCWVEW